jgi:hypothetical protein
MYSGTVVGLPYALRAIENIAAIAHHIRERDPTGYYGDSALKFELHRSDLVHCHRNSVRKSRPITLWSQPRRFPWRQFVRTASGYRLTGEPTHHKTIARTRIDAVRRHRGWGVNQLGFSEALHR